MEECRARIVEFNGNMGLAAGTVRCPDCPLNGERITGTNSPIRAMARVLQALWHRGHNGVCDGGRQMPQTWGDGTGQNQSGSWPV